MARATHERTNDGQRLGADARRAHHGTSSERLLGEDHGDGHEGRVRQLLGDEVAPLGRHPGDRVLRR